MHGTKFAYFGLFLVYVHYSRKKSAYYGQILVLRISIIIEYSCRLQKLDCILHTYNSAQCDRYEVHTPVGQ